MKTFKINGKVYFAKELDFNFLADYGDSLDSPNKSARAFLAFCGKMTEEEAGKELNQHILNDGDFDDLLECMSEALETSAFFRKISENKEAKNQPEEAEAMEAVEESAEKPKKQRKTTKA